MTLEEIFNRQDGRYVDEQYNTELIGGVLVTVPHVLQVHVQWLTDTLETFSIDLVTPTCPPIYVGYRAPISQTLPALAFLLQPKQRDVWLSDGIPNVGLLVQQLNGAHIAKEYPHVHL